MRVSGGQFGQDQSAALTRPRGGFLLPGAKC